MRKGIITTSQGLFCRIHEELLLQIKEEKNPDSSVGKKSKQTCREKRKSKRP